MTPREKEELTWTIVSVVAFIIGILGVVVLG